MMSEQMIDLCKKKYKGIINSWKIKEEISKDFFDASINDDNESEI